jgi:hypothetical protein
MSFYSQKYALEPKKIDDTVDKLAELIAALPTANPGAGILWNDGGVIKVGT